MSLLSKLAVAGLAMAVQANPISLQERDDFQSSILDVHNWYRAQHGAPPLYWDQDSANVAQGWANQCDFNHNVSD